MRILLLAPHPFFQHRGTPIAERALIRTLTGIGHEVHVLAFPEGEDPATAECEIHRTRRIPGLTGVRPGFSLKKVLYDCLMLPELLRLQRRFHFDLIHAVEESVFLALVLKRLYGVPYVYDMDSSLPQQLLERYRWLGPASRWLDWFERSAIRHSIAVLTVCRALEDRVRQYDGAALVGRVEDTSLLPQPWEPTDPGDPVEALRENGRDPLVLYVGNLERYQGVDLLLDGFALAGRSAEAARLVIIGGSERDIERYRQRAARLGLVESVRFLGPRPSGKLGEYLGQADVLVSPRIQGENTPMKIYSYLDSGRALLATRLPTHTQILTDDIACLVDPEPAALAEGLTRLLGEPAYRAALARRARERFLAAFSPAVQRERLESFYEAVEQLVAVRSGERPRWPAASALTTTGEP